MKNKNKVTKVTIGKNEAGTAEYQETGIAIEIGDVAHTIKTENAFSGETRIVYFKEQINAENFE